MYTHCEYMVGWFTKPPDCTLLAYIYACCSCYRDTVEDDQVLHNKKFTTPSCHHDSKIYCIHMM